VNSWNWEEHATLIIGGTSTFIVLLRLLSVTHFDPETAFAILQSVGTTTVIIGTLVASVWVLVAFIGIAIMRYFMHHELSPQYRTAFDCAVFAGCVVILMTAPTAAILLIIIIVAMWVHVRRSYMGTEVRSKPTRVFIEFVLGTAIALTILVGAYPWMPLERISVSNQTKVHIGYVLRTDGETVVLLNDKRRRIEYLARRGGMVDRELCNRHSGIEAALIDQPILSYLFTTSSQYPRC
jgi:hypothetical protein